MEYPSNIEKKAQTALWKLLVRWTGRDCTFLDFASNKMEKASCKMEFSSNKKEFPRQLRNLLVR